MVESTRGAGSVAARYMELQIFGYFTFPENTNNCIPFVQRQPNVFDIDPPLYNCLLGSPPRKQRRRRWANIGPTLGQCPVFAGQKSMLAILVLIYK